MSISGDVITLVAFIGSAVLMGGTLLYLGLKKEADEDGSE